MTSLKAVQLSEIAISTQLQWSPYLKDIFFCVESYRHQGTQHMRYVKKNNAVRSSITFRSSTLKSDACKNLKASVFLLET